MLLDLLGLQYRVIASGDESPPGSSPLASSLLTFSASGDESLPASSQAGNTILVFVAAGNESSLNAMAVSTVLSFLATGDESLPAATQLGTVVLFVQPPPQPPITIAKGPFGSTFPSQTGRSLGSRF